MMYESDADLIELMEEYANNHDSFDNDFVESVSNALDEYGELTDRQHEACKNIIGRFRMRQWKAQENHYGKNESVVSCCLSEEGQLVLDRNLPWENND